METDQRAVPGARLSIQPYFIIELVSGFECKSETTFGGKNKEYWKLTETS